MWQVMTKTHTRWHNGWWVLLLSLLVNTSGCIFSSESQQVRSVTDAFWQAVLQGDSTKANSLATANSTTFLQVLGNKRIVVQRFESGEIQITDNHAEVATVLYSGEKGDVLIPLRTSLILGAQGWQVDVQKTFGSLVTGAMGAVVEQLNTFMHTDIKAVDGHLSADVTQLKDHLKRELEQLQQHLKAPSSANVTPAM